MASYSTAGVDIVKVKGIHSAINDSFFSSLPPFVLPIKGHYAGLFKCGKETLAIHCDGVGSKILVADDVGKFDTVGIDCVAMNVNDVVCVGARPLVMVDYLALAKEDAALVSEIMLGLKKGADEAGCAIIGGETAILPDMIIGGKKPFDLAATCVGVVEGDVITGEKMKPGDVLVGLESSGIHSNGYTLARRLLDSKKWGNGMLVPTKIYVKPVLRMIKECAVHGIAHITGGAFSKLSRIGSYGKVGFVLDSMPKMSGVVAELERVINDDYEMHRTFNCGIGMCIACPKEDAAGVVKIASEFGIAAMKVGSVVEGSDVVLAKGGKKISLL